MTAGACTLVVLLLLFGFLMTIALMIIAAIVWKIFLAYDPDLAQDDKKDDYRDGDEGYGNYIDNISIDKDMVNSRALGESSLEKSNSITPEE